MLFPSRTIPRTLSFPPPPSFIHYVFRQFSSTFSTSNKMGKNDNKGIESSRVEPLPVAGNFDIPPDKPLSDTSHDDEEIMIGSIPVPLHGNKMKKQSRSLSTKSSTHKSSELMSRFDHLSSPKFKRRTRVNLALVQAGGDSNGESSFRSSFENDSSCTETSSTKNFPRHDAESLQQSHSRTKKAAYASRTYSPSNLNHAAAGYQLDSPVSLPKFEPYDICFHGKRNSPLIGSPFLEESTESCIGMQGEGMKERILRPGMVLLKHYISHDEQVQIVKTCSELGLGPGGFYQPGFASGAKLRLKMMCLGQDWDPQTRSYGNKRLIDGSKPPSIPHDFSKLVLRAMQEAHCLIAKECGVSCVEDILPSISPDICVVNFYTTNGRLGLHQDRDESKESLQKGLPVVSISIGDSAEFLYGDERDVEKAKNVVLESGDVLIFGGESRHVFHGVSSIMPDSAPHELLKDSSLRPGRLNLTFRQY